MDNIKSPLESKIEDFRLPRFSELPNMGLYLEQVTKYINGYITSLGCPEITSSMISNYVKKGVIASPVKKQYYNEQIAYLFFISLAKSVLTMESILKLFEIQKKLYPPDICYDYFCSEFENMLLFVFGYKDKVDSIGNINSEEKSVLRNAITAVTNIIYIDNYFKKTDKI